MPTIDEQIAAAEQQLIELKRQKQDQLGLANKFRVLERVTGDYVANPFVLIPERSVHDRAGLAAVADSLEAAGLKPNLVAGIREWIEKIENPPPKPPQP